MKNSTMGVEIRMIPIKDVHASKTNTERRKAYDKAAMQSLQSSIAQQGILQPLLVRPNESGYEVVFGERRLICAGLAGLNCVPCQVRGLTDVEALGLQVIENMERDNPPFSVEVHNVLAMLKIKGATITNVAEALGKSGAWVILRKTVGNLIKPLWDLIDTYWTPAHWLEISKLSEEQQLNYHERALSDEWTREDNRDMTVVDLRRELQNDYYRELKSVPWSLEDATLCPKAGACSTCPKRLSQRGELFPELAKGKVDICLDDKCFTEKKVTFKKHQINEVLSLHEGVKLISTACTEHVECAKGDLTAEYFNHETLKELEVKAGTKDAKPVFDVHTNKLKFIREPTKKEAKALPGATKLHKDKAPVKTLGEKRKGLAIKRDKWIAQHIIDNAMWTKVYGRTPAELLHACSLIGIIFSSGSNMMNCDLSTCMKQTEIPTNFMKKGMRWGDPIKWRTLADVDTKMLQNYCTFFNIDYGALCLKAAAEIPEPKGWTRVS